MNEFGRIAQCGSTSAYNKQQKEGELPLGSYDRIFYFKISDLNLHYSIF